MKLTVGDSFVLGNWHVFAVFWRKHHETAPQILLDRWCWRGGVSVLPFPLDLHSEAAALLHVIQHAACTQLSLNIARQMDCIP